MNPCPRQEQVSAYHDGELSPVAAQELAAHLHACPACAAELASLQRLSGWLAAQPRPELSAAARRQLHQRLEEAPEPALLRLAGYLSLVAAVVLLACSLQMFLWASQPSTPAVATWEMDALALDIGSASPEVQLASWMVNDLGGDVARPRSRPAGVPRP